MNSFTTFLPILTFTAPNNAVKSQSCKFYSMTKGKGIRSKQSNLYNHLASAIMCTIHIANIILIDSSLFIWKIHFVWERFQSYIQRGLNIILCYYPIYIWKKIFIREFDFLFRFLFRVNKTWEREILKTLVGLHLLIEL